MHKTIDKIRMLTLSYLFIFECYWCPDEPLKNQSYYELILVDTGSVEIIAKPNPSNPKEIAHCKCIIKKVCSLGEWASIYSKKNFSVRRIPEGFIYQDYKQAWYRAFLFRPFDHS